MQPAIAISDHSELRERVLAYLEDHTTFNLATAGPAGVWASAVLYINEGIELYFTSVGATRHGQNIHATGIVAGTINEDCRSYETMRGIQLQGTVAHVTDHNELRRAVRAYLRRFPFAAALWNGETNPEVIARDPGSHNFYRITPTKLLFTDHEYALGSREELPLE